MLSYFSHDVTCYKFRQYPRSILSRKYACLEVISICDSPATVFENRLFELRE